jgi:hypothetical protein
MRPQERTIWRVLAPYDVREGISPGTAARLAGKSQRTIRVWCNERGLGRRVGGGVWVVSKIALTMYLDGDAGALKAYLAGDRSSIAVRGYFERCGVPLPQKISPATSAALTYQSNRPAAIIDQMPKPDLVANG